ncbi:site-2 protease family protein [Virgibacillus necropolis]|uniref:Site-2 protease family protein n=1 Tax=Virgibacillus necropolis TaxID=163877 RepID=A0A221MEW3_9BACI|nr:site-2 protease family protein [Virgibacillus necropolis]ASN06174.1 site-2 protease family protein [Virgibacillus necropolis]
MATTSEQKTTKSYWGWLAVIGVFLLTKAKWLLVVLKIGKFATLASMFISLWAYAVFYGWKFAIALVYLIFVHEMGHLVAAKMKKIPTSPAIFIPFLGAAIGIDPNKIKNAKTEFFVAYGGPLAGLLSIVPAIVLYLVTDDPYWVLVIQLGALINLFNLFPVSPLDGGRIVSVLSPNIWIVGLLVLIPIIFLSPDPILFLIFIFGLVTWWKQFKESKNLATMKHEEKVLSYVNNELEKFKENCEFYGENEYTTLYNKLKKQKDKVSHFLSNNSGFKMPLFQEKKRLEIKKSHVEKKVLINTLNDLDRTRYTSEVAPRFDVIIEYVQRKNETERLRIKNEVTRIKTYYRTSLQTKIKSLVLYLSLAVLLAIILVYAMDILESSRLTNF